MKQTTIRFGFSMLEVMAVISVTGVLLVLTTGWIHQTMRCASRFNQLQRHHQSLTRMGCKFRDDVRQCNSIGIRGEHCLVLTWDDGSTASYTISDQTIVFEKRNSKPDSNPQVVHERFEFSPGSLVSWDSTEMPDWISLVVSRRPNQATEQASESEEPGIVDLHIRVAPHRWPVDFVEPFSATNHQGGGK